MHLKTMSAKWQPFCPGGDELIGQDQVYTGAGFWQCRRHLERCTNPGVPTSLDTLTHWSLGDLDTF